jgi:hypothetical protein
MPTKQISKTSVYAVYPGLESVPKYALLLFLTLGIMG